MAWGLLFVGIILAVSAIKGNHQDLFALVRSDFTGEGNFFLWILSVVILIGIGNIKALRPLTDAFVILIILVIVLASRRNGTDIFSSFIEQIKSGTGNGGGSDKPRIPTPWGDQSIKSIKDNATKSTMDYIKSGAYNGTINGINGPL